MRRFALAPIALSVAAATLLPLAQAQAAFRDVPASASYAHAVALLEQLGVVSGMGDGTFRPGAPVTRAEYLKMLFGALNRTATANALEDDGSTLLPFTDVPAESWMAPYVRAAYIRGVARGTTETTFSPSRTVTLYEATRMLLALEFQQATLGDTLLPVNEETAKANITSWLTRQNIVSGALALDRPLSRGAVCEMLFRWIVVKKTDAAQYDPSLDSQLTVVQFAVPASGVEGARALREILDVIEANYLHADDVHALDVLDEAPRGVVDALGDPHSSYYTGQDSQDFLNAVGGVNVGIGVFLSLEPDALVIMRILPGSPAEKAGLAVGDRITAIDGYVVNDDPLAAFAYLANLNTVGQLISIDVQRVSGGKDQLRLALAEVTQPAIELKMIEQGLLGIRIWEFTPGANDELVEAMKSVDRAQVKGVLIDLRNNPGGLIDTAVELASHFLQAGRAVAIVENPQAERVLTVARDGDMIGMPIVILVDGGSASASEILAATLRENAKATLVGEQTYGKGTVQALIPIGTQSLLRLTVARWLTPTGASVTGVGLKPNLDVPMSIDDAMQGNDVQYAAALDLLRRLIQN